LPTGRLRLMFTMTPPIGAVGRKKSRDPEYL
jgi:hypothetical protein